ncbi:MAG: hypothetical protein U0744_06690 [Gemmataceae bacterium]
MEPKSAACIAALVAFAFWSASRNWHRTPEEVADIRIGKSIRKSMDDIHVEVMSGKRSLAEGSRHLTTISLKDETVRIAYEVAGKPLHLRSADFLLQWTEDMTRQPNEPHRQLAAEALDRLRSEHAAMHDGADE